MNATTARTRTARTVISRATLHGDTARQVTAVIPDLGALVHGAPTLLAGRLLLSIRTPLRTEDRS